MVHLWYLGQTDGNIQVPTRRNILHFVRGHHLPRKQVNTTQVGTYIIRWRPFCSDLFCLTALFISRYEKTHMPDRYAVDPWTILARDRLKTWLNHWSDEATNYSSWLRFCSDAIDILMIYLRDSYLHNIVPLLQLAGVASVSVNRILRPIFPSVFH